MLWHGTNNLDSEVFTDSEEGFDLRFASNGEKFGKGNYFYKDAKKC